jgi:diguanylate cyclase (GGDEF)-like protein
MRSKRRRDVPVGLISVLAVSSVFVALFFINSNKYLLFHTFIELFSVIVCCCVFAISTFTYAKGKNAFSLLGLGYLVVGIIDLLHAMSYQGMNAIDSGGSYVMQLWICARFIEAVTILLFLVQMKRNVVSFFPALVAYSLALFGVVLSVFIFRNFPACFVAGQQTPFKIISETIICIVLAMTVAVLRLKRPIANRSINRHFSSSLVLIFLSELCLIVYRDPLGVLNVASHILKAMAYYFVYRSILLINVQEPLTIIFGELHKKERRISRLLKELEIEKNAAVQSSMTDGLTGIRNRRYFDEIMNEKYERAKREGQPLSLLMIDIDYFKNYNDRYGHVLGDDCLKKVALALQNSINRATDTLVRYGGEEFIAILENTDSDGARLIAMTMKTAVSDLRIEHETSKCADCVTVSVGTMTIRSFTHESIDDVVRIVDAALYRAKSNGRNRIESEENVETSVTNSSAESSTRPS